MTTVRDPPPAAHGVGRRGPSGVESRRGARPPLAARRARSLNRAH
ncbi:hypothetical protein BMAJHU_I0187 [Burkholderia mallei JHU]|nr:hypothetical protein BMAFMH_E0190 [Burkholderia mallei FMH]EDK61187.1 hypothetical protein BMAJHU_I0187 [Burkholderia mallei JHU]EEP85140.1 conserved hypothetical protein [Burkholderia mallei GB8 horse 4]